MMMKVMMTIGHRPVESQRYGIQLMNGIIWKGKFYYRDVLKLTITRAKSECNGNFYHIKVRDLPFHINPIL